MKLIMYFFFSSRRRHTRCSRDWSSDVCSSDLSQAADKWAQYQAKSVRLHETQGFSDVVNLVAAMDQGKGDRKSTRLNSSHGYISYAVFCLKKKKLVIYILL